MPLWGYLMIGGLLITAICFALNYSAKKDKVETLQQEVVRLTEIVKKHISIESHEKASAITISTQLKELEDKKKKLQSEEIRLEHNLKMLEIKSANIDKELSKKRNNAEREIKRMYSDAEAKYEIIEKTKSNLTLIPYAAAIIADFETHGLDILADKLDWGYNQERLKKVKSIREIKKDAAEIIAHSKEAQYQLEYAIKMFPGLADYLETDYRSVPKLEISELELSNRDAAIDYLTKEEYEQLSTAERNQRALDRYQNSRRKSNWEIGRDYELYVGYRYSLEGYSIDYYGSNNDLEDLGRDLIAKKGDQILIIQCKFWSAHKQIHENHINQLFGTTICYCLENNIPRERVKPVLVTNITLSETAKRFAKYLDVEFVENYELGDYPCIKCNINRSQDGTITKIYHLPFDQQYDSCKINSPGEFFALTVAEAEAAGFRRAFRWHSYE